jgi:FkbM family methyltransferase
VSARVSLPGPLKRAGKVAAGWIFSLRRHLAGRGREGGRRVRPPREDAEQPGLAPERSAGGAVEVAPEILNRVSAANGVIAANEHGLYCVPRASQHRPVAQAILRGSVWEADTLALLGAAEPTGDVVHAGTFFGDFLPALARSRAEGARVWAFEPGRENHRCAQITVLLNDLHNVELAPAGLGAEAGAAQLAIGDRAGVPLGGASRIVRDPARARWWSAEEVRVTTIDAALGPDRKVAVLHLDVEGHEQEALTGALATIARSGPLIVLETLPSADWLADNLEPLGYGDAGTVDRNHVLRRR